ncbi:MAG: colanic acid biosynthesis glycosyltransferase WcaL [Candidatus Binatia bacterium]|nr:MAG: colanic acid biosynthesis glycosyltransferase WcaL [Candidatus Binatia bacterium]
MTPGEARPGRELAYLFPAFPVFHQTFVLWEVLGVRRCGLDPKIYSLRGPSKRQQPEGEKIIPEVRYLPGWTSARLWRDNWELLRRRPGVWFDAFRSVVLAWRSGADVRLEWPGARRPTWYNRLRGWYNTHPLLYLLRSLALVPVAVHLARKLREDGVGHLHAHWMTYPATVAYVVHRLTGIPFSLSAHAYDIYMVQRMIPEKLRAASFVVTCAKANAAFLGSLAPDAAGRIHVLYHGVDTRRFRPGGNRGDGGGPLHLVSCGQLERYKGMHLLVDACGILKTRGVDLRCRIVGEGPERRSLERQIRARGLEGTVELLGALPQVELARILRESDIFVLASELAGRSRRRDVIANVVVEAMASGLPVVASKVPGIEELVADGQTGCLFPPNRTDELARAILKLAAEPSLRRRFGEAARRRVVEEFDSEKNVRRLAELLRGCTSDRTESALVG